MIHLVTLLPQPLAGIHEILTVVVVRISALRSLEKRFGVSVRNMKIVQHNPLNMIDSVVDFRNLNSSSFSPFAFFDGDLDRPDFEEP